MAERNQLVKFFAIIVLLAISGLILPTRVRTIFQEAYISNYEASLYPNGTLIEHFTYKLNVNGKKFLFTNWEDTLTLNSLNSPHIELVELQNPSDTVPYIKDHRGIVTLLDKSKNDNSLLQDIRMLAFINEVGAYKPDGYLKGSYKVTYIYRIHPRVEYDSQDHHLNIKLAAKHLEYKKAKIVIKDSKYITKVYPHPPTLKRSEKNQEIILEGELGKDELLEIEMLINSDHSFDAFENFVEGVKDKTIEANRTYNLEYFSASTIMWINKLSGLGFIALFYFIYKKFGVEENFTIPTYLSTVPNQKRKAWLVNLVFKNDARDYDEDGLYSTLLDLHLKEKLKIEKIGDNDFKIEILNRNELDNYESYVMEFLDRLAVRDEVDTRRLKSLADAVTHDENIAKTVMDLQKMYHRLTNGPDKIIADQFTINGRTKVIPILIFSIILLFIPIIMFSVTENVSRLLMHAIGFALIPITQSIVSFAFPSTLFGKWKQGIYKEKLEWDSFRRHLSDFSQLQRYKTESLNMWGKWLVYGTSLGVGKKVAEAMRQLQIPYVPANFVPVMPYMFSPIYSARIPSRGGGYKGGGFTGSGSGGFGAGGGFGGGGAGVR